MKFIHPVSQSSKMQKILVLAALPDRLRLDQEIREIEEAIKRAVKRDSFEIKIITAVRPQDIRRAIKEEKPHIVHFCGHGQEDGSLVLEDDSGNHKPVSSEGLAALFKLHSDYVKCVLLNACYSETPAEAISQYINYVIGMNKPIQDKAAIEFARGFYDGLGYTTSDNQDMFQRAFDEGMVAIQLENFSQRAIPVFKKNIKPQVIHFEETESINARLFKLSNIPITGFEASEVGANYTKLRNLLLAQKFGEADEETAAIILWVAKREQEGWLREEDIKNFPALDLYTINTLWLVGSDGKFGFSIQKQIWIDVGGNFKAYEHKTFKRFLKSVEWEEESKVIFDIRAKRGHLPLAMYVKVIYNARLNQKWWASINQYEPRLYEGSPMHQESEGTIFQSLKPRPKQLLTWESLVKMSFLFLLGIITPFLGRILFQLSFILSYFYLSLLIIVLFLFYLSFLYVFKIYNIWQEEELARKIAEQKLEREIRENLPYFSLLSRTDI